MAPLQTGVRHGFFAEHITLETLSREVNLSESALLRAFSKNLGISPYRYLLSIRVDRAAALLREEYRQRRQRSRPALQTRAT